MCSCLWGGGGGGGGRGGAWCRSCRWACGCAGVGVVNPRMGLGPWVKIACVRGCVGGGPGAGAVAEAPGHHRGRGGGGKRKGGRGAEVHAGACTPPYATTTSACPPCRSLWHSCLPAGRCCCARVLLMRPRALAHPLPATGRRRQGLCIPERQVVGWFEVDPGGAAGPCPLPMTTALLCFGRRAVRLAGARLLVHVHGGASNHLGCMTRPQSSSAAHVLWLVGFFGQPR